MKYELDIEDLQTLVKGSVPYYSVFENPIVKKCGNWVGGMADKWRWDNSALGKLSEEELYVLYVTCKNSWKENGR
jgi:hypothetical protein